MDFIMEHRFDEESNRWIITFSGEIDIFNSDKMKSELIELTRERQADLFIDCRNLDYVDSTGLGALVAVLRNVKVYNGEIHLQHIKPSLAKLFKITNLNKVFIIEGDAHE